MIKLIYVCGKVTLGKPNINLVYDYVDIYIYMCVGKLHYIYLYMNFAKSLPVEH